jgi:hypothetical protein
MVSPLSLARVVRNNPSDSELLGFWTYPLSDILETRESNEECRLLGCGAV